ncbi:hypothetical protein ACFO3O_05765 [Dokdonia ponticola]|uniref:Sugar-binding protein n=1 Tax=Dokdonia ponticola TaxID=2041041 RepID=A0ABV9HU65_9FLAO
MNLFGSVKRINIYSVKINNNIDTLKFRSGVRHIIHFNKKGFVKERKKYHVDSTFDSQTIYEYNEHERIITSIRNYPNLEDDTSKTLYQYKDGLLLSQKTKKLNGNFDGKMLYFYNDNRLLKEKWDYRWNDSIYEKEVYEYDSNSDITKTIFYDSRGEIKSIDISTYYGNRKIKSLSVLDSTQATQQFYFYQYDYLGNRSKFITKKNNSVIEKVFIFKYDSFNNWTQRITLENGVKTSETTQEIEYY